MFLVFDAKFRSRITRGVRQYEAAYMLSTDIEIGNHE